MSEKPINCNPHNIWKNAKQIVQESQMNLLGYFKSVLETCFTTNGVKAGVKTMKTKTKRRPSGYNLFIGSCMKEGSPMKECAANWKSIDKERWNQQAKNG
jgi:hypothetical protein